MKQKEKKQLGKKKHTDSNYTKRFIVNILTVL